MKTLKPGVWRRLNVSPKELRLETTLKAGQSFRWTETGKNEWSNVLENNVISLKQTDEDVEYRLHFHDSDKDVGLLLRNYFQLNVSLEQLYKKWADLDPNFKNKAVNFQGVRVLRQDPVENLITFICTSNNNIARITLMISKLSEKYGKLLGHLETSPEPLPMYCFPEIDRLAKEGVEEELRQMGFGYRAKFIHQTARHLTENHKDPVAFLHSLRQEPYDTVNKELLKFTGVGPKVADCIALMSLDKTEAVPVDVHVWRIAVRDYNLTGVESKSLTDKSYRKIANHFKDLFGDYSGWAHSILFTADLRSFANRLETPPETPKKRKSSEKSKKPTPKAPSTES